MSCSSCRGLRHEINVFGCQRGSLFKPGFNFKLHLYFPGGGWGCVGGWAWVVIIKLKTNLSSTGTGLPTGTELDKSGMLCYLQLTLSEPLEKVK